MPIDVQTQSAVRTNVRKAARILATAVVAGAIAEFGIHTWWILGHPAGIGVSAGIATASLVVLHAGRLLGHQQSRRSKRATFDQSVRVTYRTTHATSAP